MSASIDFQLLREDESALDQTDQSFSALKGCSSVHRSELNCPMRLQSVEATTAAVTGNPVITDVLDKVKLRNPNVYQVTDQPFPKSCRQHRPRRRQLPRPGEVMALV